MLGAKIERVPEGVLRTIKFSDKSCSLLPSVFTMPCLDGPQESEAVHIFIHRAQSNVRY